MPRRKYLARLDNIYFLGRVGQSLRWATSDITREELPEDINRLLRRLERIERRDSLRSPGREKCTKDAGN